MTWITPDSVTTFANLNTPVLKWPIRGICLEFPGLDGGSCVGGSLTLGAYTEGLGKVLGEAGILLAYAFTGPWSWMNPGAVRIADEIVDALREKFDCPNVPLCCVGGSMGGLGALIYAAASRHVVSACAAVCPCTDFRVGFASTPELTRSFLPAVAALGLPYEEALKVISPIDRIDEMPHIPYWILADGADALFPSDAISQYVAALHARNHLVDYRILPGCTHGEMTPEARADLGAFLRQSAEK